MILNLTQQDSDASSNEYFDALRQKNYDASFEGMKSFIEENNHKLRNRRQRKPIRKWKWVLAALVPLFVVLACTKTERSEPVGNTISFTLPELNDAGRKELESVIGDMQTVVRPDAKKPGHLLYTGFVPAQSSPSADAIVQKLKRLKGIDGLSTIPVNAQVRESLLSQLGGKIFSTHIKADALSDGELSRKLKKQLQEQGFNNVEVTVGKDENGVRTLKLLPVVGGSDDPNYFIDVSIEDKGTRMELQEVKRTGSSSQIVEPKVDFGSMTDAQVKDYIRSKYGKELSDENIKITRTPKEIEISIKKDDKTEEIIAFKL